MPKYADMGERIIANSVLSPDTFFQGTPCWIWVGKTRTNRTGEKYPAMNLRYQRGPRKGMTKTVGAHRESLRFFKNRIVNKNTVTLHLCNNPLCVNPAHLSGGSQKKNMRQCVAEGRHKTPFRGEA